MTKYAIGFEGMETSEGRYLGVGAVRLEDVSIPVGVHDLSVEEVNIRRVGTARDLQRNSKTGELSVEITTTEDLSQMHAHMYLNKVRGEKNEDGVLIVHDAVLKELFFSQRPNLRW